ncbi:PglZ domain-containing protein [Thiohalocapsa marina]|uniref:PglZ domain-containing protein n=1 Tax=Thiohalocapsa marina TaxID=424902 RepID=A0A5M8FDU6_9GAMM|nr:alkaline phosphatase family protein [Thiohalocapsa marina]KAA6183043.1 PglZ domain-containing protein [Thiohalocapsa marina]
MSIPLQDDLQAPCYHGGGIINLMASLIRARGGAADHADLDLLPAAELADVQHIVLLVIDGLGADWLKRHGQGGIFGSHVRGAITSVFPPTTATAITSYLTGDAPQQHALTGWHTWMRELGCVMAVLPGRPRYGGVGYHQAHIDAAALFGHRSVFDRMQAQTFVVSPAHIAHSDYNRAHLGAAQLRTFENLRQMFKETARILRKCRSHSYSYLYWPGLDSIGHERGMESEAAVQHLRQLEQGLEDFLRLAAGTDTRILVCADHGQIDTSEADQTRLSDHPQLADCLTLPLCGEPRAAFCYVRPHRVAVFEDYCRDVLGDRFALYRSRELVDGGLFGPGRPHPQLEQRVGDYTLLGRGHAVIRDYLPFEKPFRHIGVHGGLSPAELMVPLCVLDAGPAHQAAFFTRRSQT